MHDLGFDHEHEESLTDAERLAIAAAIWEQETVDLLTVGFDIGSSTSHLLFARVVLRREESRLSSRFIPVERHVLWRSPIVLTPFLANGNIDAAALRRFRNLCYEEAGIGRDDVDSGAVILTGEAIKRHNARAIDEIFADEAGRFVCATAGHRLESMLAAQGSGAVALSRKRGQRALHVDIGGGTTKLAMIDHGVVESVAAFAVGGRLLAQDESGAWTRIDEAAATVARALGLDPTPATIEDPAHRRAIVERLADIALDQITGAPPDTLGKALMLTDELERGNPPDYVTFSGGVAEYLFDYEQRGFGDIAKPLADALARKIAERLPCKVVDPGQRIRATVIGASQFTVQVSGNTLHLDSQVHLPLHNVPVLRLEASTREDAAGVDPGSIAAAIAREAALHDIDLSSSLAIALSWNGPPDHEALHALCRGLVDGVGTGRGEDGPLIVAVDADIALTLGRIMKEEMGYRGPLLCVDSVHLASLDFLDVGMMIEPAGVVPIVIKSLLFH